MNTTNGLPAGIAEDAGIQRSRIAGDLLLLADLHGRALQRDTIVRLWENCYDGLLDLKPCSVALRDAVNAFCKGLTAIPTCFDQQTAELLRRDFILVHGPMHSNGDRISMGGWDSQRTTRRIDPDAMGRWAGHHGQHVQSWSLLGDNHLAVQLRWLAYMIAEDGVAAPAASVVQILQQQLLTWIDWFPDQVQNLAESRLYSDLAVLTAAYLHQVEDHFSRVHDLPECSLQSSAGNRSVDVVTDKLQMNASC